VNQSDPKFDQLLHRPICLAVVGYLERCGGRASFVETCAAIGIQHYGNLSHHARSLEDAGYIQLSKAFISRRVRTELVLTDRGRRAFACHKAALAEITNSQTTVTAEVLP
jgi:DNA-binding MarR family transcriptional regulator